MYLRATLGTLAPERLDDLVAYVQNDVQQALGDQPGSRGLAMAVDRPAGHCSIVSFWDDKDALTASEAGVTALRNRAAELYGVTFEVRVAEVVEQSIRQPPEPGCWNRVSVLEVPPADIDAAIETFRVSTLPALDAIPGFCGAFLGIEREAGRAVAVTTWRDRNALDASADRADSLRREVRDKSHGEIADVRMMEIVIFDMTA